jgi:hypothetical protein
MYCITLRSRIDARITGWYDGSDSRWSTDPKRQNLFDKKRDARPTCRELRKLCPRNAKFINVEAAHNVVLEGGPGGTPPTSAEFKKDRRAMGEGSTSSEGLPGQSARGALRWQLVRLVDLCQLVGE